MAPVQPSAISPPQLDPGTCDADALNGQTVCAHANAVYLDGSGQEQTASTGEGTWWMTKNGTGSAGWHDAGK